MFKKYTTLLNLLDLARTSYSRLGLVTMLFFYLATVQAGQVTLAWDANTEPTLGGYRLCYGRTSKTYTANVDVGNKTTYTVTGLQDGATYYFAVKAYDSARTTESGFSNEVSRTLAGAGSPQANFIASPILGTAPLLVRFTDTSTGSITNWSWNFGDGTSPVTSRNALHTYSTPGIYSTYTVRLTVSGPGGSHTATKTNYISVIAAPPVANFSASPTTGTAPLTVPFTNTSTGTMKGWSWNFGDGSTSTAKTPAYTYAAAGAYTVSLTTTGPGSGGSLGGTVTLLGHSAIGQMTDSIPQRMAAAFQTQAAATGFLTGLSVYVNGGSTATQLIAGLYSNNNGHPGNLLAQGTLNNPVADTWNKVPLLATKINAGSLYWIAILSPNGILQFRDNVGGASQYHETSAQINLINLPNTWTTGIPSYNGPLSAYGSVP